MRVADEARPGSRSRRSTARRPAARARTPRPGRAGRRGRARRRRRCPRARARAGSRASRGGSPRASTGRRARPRARTPRATASPTTARSWLPARQIVQCARGELDAGVRLGAVADEIAEAPQLLRAVGLGVRRSPPRRRVGCRGCLTTMATCMARVIVCSVLQRLRLPVAVLAALAVAEVAVLLAAPARPAGAGARSRREPTSARSRWKRPSTSAAASCGCTASRLAIELGVLILTRAAPARALADVLRRRPLLGGAAAAAAMSVALTRRDAAGVGDLAPARDRRRAGHPQLARLGGRRAQERGDRRGARGRGRRAARGRHAPLRPRLVAAGRRARGRASASAITLAGPIVLDPLFNRFDAAAARASCARTCWRWPSGPGVDVGEVYVDGRLEADDGGERVRGRARRARSASCSTTT